MLTVGVAPGTTTMQLGAPPSARTAQLVTPRPYEPEERRWMFADRWPPNSQQVAHPSGMGRVYYDPYAFDIWRLRGLGATLSSDLHRMRWDLVGLVGGGAFLVAALTSFLASRLPRRAA